jgi:hypothetical protein
MNYKLISAFSALLSAYSLFAHPLDNWVQIEKPSSAGALAATAYGNGKFIAVGQGGTILTSSDGAVWTQQTSGTTANFNYAKYTGGRFFAFGVEAAGGITSIDGVTWDPAPAFTDVAYFKGEYYACYWDQTVARSVDAVTWTTLPGAGGRYLEVHGSTLLLTEFVGTVNQTTDGVTWTRNSQNSKYGAAVLSSQNGALFASYPTTLLVQVFPDPFPSPRPFTVVDYTTDLQNYSTVHKVHGGGLQPSQVITGGTNYVIVIGQSIYYTGDLASPWTAVALPAPISSRSSLTFGSSHFITVAGGQLFRSEPVGGAFAPQIVKQPVSFSATVSGAAQFSVTAQGTGPMSYQWRKNGTNITSGTASTFALTNVTLEDAGEYDVVVTNSAGSATSSKAVLSINFAEAHTYAGVTIKGAIGDKFLIEAKDQLESATWEPVTTITLSATSYIWIDYSSPDAEKRFFRATFQGR